MIVCKIHMTNQYDVAHFAITVPVTSTIAAYATGITHVPIVIIHMVIIRMVIIRMVILRIVIVPPLMWQQLG